MQRVGGLGVVLLVAVLPSLAGEPGLKPLATGLKNATAVAVGADGRIYVARAGDVGKDGEGAILALDKGKAVPFAANLDHPQALASFQKSLFVADGQRVLRFDLKGKMTVLAAKEAFPNPPARLSALTVDPENGTVYVADGGDKEGRGAAIYRITQKGKASVAVVTDQARWPELQRPTAIVLDGQNHLLVLDSTQ